MKGKSFERECVCVLIRSFASDFLQSMDYSPPGFSVLGIFQAKNTGVGCHFLLQGIFPTQRWKLRLLHFLHRQADSLPLCHLGSP